MVDDPEPGLRSLQFRREPRGTRDLAESADAQDPRRGLTERAVDTSSIAIAEGCIESLHDPRSHHKAGHVVGRSARKHHRFVDAERVQTQTARRLGQLLPPGAISPRSIVAERRYRGEDPGETIGPQ